ncbi:MAG: hypothetical protein WD690_00650 [Vicinamibacterales bacterium]
MSVEFFLAVVFFVLLPLIERLLRGARERGTEVPGPARPQPRQPQPPLPLPASDDQHARRMSEATLPDLSIPQVQPAPVRSRMPSRATAHDRRTDDAFKHARDRGRRRNIAAALHTEAGVRHAIVLMTILGPCRAFEPYDA